MRVKLERTALNRALSHVHRVVERRNTIPILSNVLLQASDGMLRLKATDLDIEVIESVPADVSVDGGTTAPAHTFNDIVKKIPEGAEIELALDQGSSTMTLSAGRSRFSIQTLPAADFPDIATAEFPHSFSLTAGQVRQLIDKTQFAISNEETRYYLNGIYLHAPEGDTPLLRAVATDGHRLAQYEMACPDGAAGMPGIIIPRKTVGEVQRLIEDDEAAIGIELSDAKIRFTIGAVVLTSKLIDGTFPDYERVIPRNNEKILNVDRSSFAAAVDRVSTISTERGKAVKLSIGPDLVHLSVNNPESGTANEEVAAAYADDPIDIGFNARYLLDITDRLTGDQASMRFADPGSPTLVEDPSDGAALFVIMPMRV